MSCDKCDQFENKGKTADYRWGKANIGMIGCEEHLKEIFDVLNKAQNPPYTFNNICPGCKHMHSHSCCDTFCYCINGSEDKVDFIKGICPNKE